MGSGHSVYLSNDEIRQLTSNNQTLDIYFKKNKKENSIPEHQFSELFNRLLEKKILKRLFQMVSTNQETLSKEDYLYLYSLFFTSNQSAKLNFILDFIFIKHDSLPIDKFKKKVNKYFGGTPIETLLLNKTNNQTISRADLYSIILKQFLPQLTHITFLAKSDSTNKDNNNNNSINTKIILVRNNNSFECNCNNALIRKQNTLVLNRTFSSRSLHGKEFSKLEKQFRQYEINNNGIFPISLFEKMLNEIHVDQVLVGITTKFLKKKTDKSFFNFDLFKTTMSLLSMKQNNLKKTPFEGIFEIVSFPNNYIKKNILTSLGKSLGEDKKMTKALNKTPDHIQKADFYQITEVIEDELYDNIKRVNSLQYMYFGIKPDKDIDKADIIIYMLNGEKVEDYVKRKANEEKDFFLVDSEFWKNLKSYFNKIKAEEEEEDDEENETHNGKDLVIDTSSFSDQNGKIKKNAKYIKDYFVLTSKLYELLASWYGPPNGVEVLRHKLFLADKPIVTSPSKVHTKSNKKNQRKKPKDEDSEDEDSESSDDSSSYNSQDNASCLKKSTSPITGIDMKTKLPYEVELFPIFLQFFSFSDLMKKCSNIHEIKEHLKKSFEGKNQNSSFYSYTRKDSFLNILYSLRETVPNTLNENTARFWIYYNETFRVVDIHSTLERSNIVDSAILVLEIKSQGGKWPSDDIDSKLTSDIFDTKETKDLNIMVGLDNIGNSCYLNSILQTFLNNIDLKNLLFRNSHGEANDSTKKTNKISKNGNNNSSDELLDKPWIDFLTNTKNKNKNRTGKLFLEFLEILKEKWYGKSKKIVPQKFKDICGEYNKDFANSYQQDAHDFLNFLIDSLNEDTNLKQSSGVHQNSETIDTNAYDLGNEYWANNFRNNVSLFHGLFLGQLKNILRCSKCNTEKISFETFSSLSLPIPESTTLSLDIILMRLPFTMKSYYDKIHDIKDFNLSLKDSLKKIKTMALFNDEDFDSSNDSLIAEEETNLKKTKSSTKLPLLSTHYFKDKKKNKFNNDNAISNTLNIQIPVRIKLDIPRKEKCRKIIDMLKDLKELELEQDNENTYFLITNHNEFVDDDLTIDECFETGQIAHIYEILNYKGIQKFYDYNSNNLSSTPLLPISSNKKLVPYMIKMMDNDDGPVIQSTTGNMRLATVSQKNINNNQLKPEVLVPDPNKNIEVLVPVVHRSKVNKAHPEYFIIPTRYEDFPVSRPDYILLTTKNTMKVVDLYDFIWEKYSYFLNSPAKYERTLWWKSPKFQVQKFVGRQKGKYATTNPVKVYNPGSMSGSSEEYQNLRYNEGIEKSTIDKSPMNALQVKCKPFVLKLLKKDTGACMFCPWYKLCNGCVLDPQSQNFVSCDYNSMLVVEWCREVYLKDLVDKNMNLVLTNENSHRYETTETEVSDQLEKGLNLDRCLHCFTAIEEIKDFNCEKCKAKTTFKKKYEIEKLPKYLILTIKRFKFTSLYQKKIDFLIHFPLEQYDLSNYVSKYNQEGDKKNANTYDLFAVVNHIGTLERGHYISIVKHEHRWIKYDDSFVSETQEDIQSNSVYILIYKKREEPNIYFNYFGLIDTAFRIYMEQKINFLYKFNFELDKKTGKFIKENTEGLSQFYYGEPVNVKEGKGFIVNIYKDRDEYIVRIKLKKGFCEVKLSEEPDMKETLKNFSSDEIESVEEGKGKRICDGCTIY